MSHGKFHRLAHALHERGCHDRDRRHAHEDGEEKRGGWFGRLIDHVENHHGRGGMGRGGRLGRLFAHGDLHLVILHLIAEKPRHGYEIIKAITDLTGGVYTPSPGTIYPALTLLEEQGHITAAAQTDGKKSFTLTESGQDYLTSHQAAVSHLLARVQQAGARAPSPRLMRAMENLKMALRLRHVTPLSEEQLQKLVDILDNAARDVERV